jgi:hypothetical protein
MDITDKNTMNELGKILLDNLVCVPKKYDMHGENFNCDCHFEVGDSTYTSISNKFSITPIEAISVVTEYFKMTSGKI